jgi:hypothetical protein
VAKSLAQAREQDRDRGTSRQRPDECLDYARVELPAGFRLQCLDRAAWTKARPIGSRRRHGVEGVGDGDDAGEQRDVFTAQSVRITGSAPRFMVMEYGLRNAPITRLRHEPRTDNCMRLDERFFARR